MATLGRWRTAAILGLAAGTFVYGFLLRNYAAGEMFLAAWAWPWPRYPRTTRNHDYYASPRCKKKAHNVTPLFVIFLLWEPWVQ